MEKQSRYVKGVPLLALLLLLMAAQGMRAQSSTPLETNDRFTVSELQSADGYYYFVVSLDGGKDDPARRYCAYNMTITLPPGLEFLNIDGALQVYSSEDASLYPYTGLRNNKKFKHTVEGATPSSPSVAKVICYSGSNDAFKAASGDLFTIYVQPTPWAKAGDNEVKLTGLNLTVKENAQAYIPVGDLNTGTITLPAETDTREVSVAITEENKYGTCILPFSCTLPAGVTAYEAQGVAGDVLTLRSVATMEAYKPYVLYAPGGFSGTLTGTADGEAYPVESPVVNVGGLCGVIAQTSVSEGYIMQNQGEGAQLYRIGNTPFTLRAGRCYLASSATASSKVAFRLIDGESSAVLSPESSTAERGSYYNLAGQRVAEPSHHGVYIRNGRKVVK